MSSAIPESEGDLNTTRLRSRWRNDQLDAETRAWLDEDARYFLHQSLSTPCINVLRRCEGAVIEDLQGRSFLDFHGNNVHNVGFSNPHVVAAITAQMAELSFCTRRYTNLPAVRLAKKLAHLSPGGPGKVLFAPGGSEAISIALKLARIATGRYKTISLWDSFHGASLDAASVGGEALFRDGMGPLLPGALHVPPPDCAACPFACAGQCNLQCARYVEYVLEKERDVGAVVVETVRATSLVPPPGYLKLLREACDRHGALFILDEVPHALGRTGRMFSCEHFDVAPDILVIGKALGGGIFPLAAIIARPELDVTGDRALGHYTHEKNPVACAAALAAIEYIEQERLCQRAAELGRTALERLERMSSERPLIRAVHGLGLLLGIELVPNPEPPDAAERIMYLCLERGLSFKVTMGRILTLTPPLTVSDEQMDRALEILDSAIAEVERPVPYLK